MVIEIPVRGKRDQALSGRVGGSLLRPRIARAGRRGGLPAARAEHPLATEPVRTPPLERTEIGELMRIDPRRDLTPCRARRPHPVAHLRGSRVPAPPGRRPWAESAR